VRRPRHPPDDARHPKGGRPAPLCKGRCAAADLLSCRANRLGYSGHGMTRSGVRRWRDLPRYAWERSGVRTLGLRPRLDPDGQALVRIRAWARSCRNPALSICIPIKNRLDLLVPCLDSLAATSTGRPVEVVLGDTGSTEETLDFCAALGLRIVSVPGPFNFSRACNEVAKAARGDALLFLNNDTTAISTDWFDRLLDLGEGEVVGAVLVYPGTRRIQHAGVTAVSGDGLLKPNAYRPSRSSRTGPAVALQNIGIGKPLESRRIGRGTVMAVTGAFLGTTRSAFFSRAGFDEAFQADLQDIDYCLRARACGSEVICRGDIVFSHKHAASRGRYRFPLEDWRLLLDRWGAELESWTHVDPDRNGAPIQLSPARTASRW
jgi:GT2 family glycosyltransferase